MVSCSLVSCSLVSCGRRPAPPAWHLFHPFGAPLRLTRPHPFHPGGARPLPPETPQPRRPSRLGARHDRTVRLAPLPPLSAEVARTFRPLLRLALGRRGPPARSDGWAGVV